jgi:hypothetical protein
MRLTRYCAAIAILLALATAPPASSYTSNELGRGADARHDVHLKKTPGLSTADRRTVDLRGLTITRTPTGPRFDLRVKRVATDNDFNQYFFVYLYPASGDNSGIGYLKVRAANLRTEAGYDFPDSYATCRPSAHVSRKHTRLTVLLPWRCVPTAEVRVSALAYTTPLGRQGGSKVYSTDRMRLRTLVDFRR